MTTFYCGATPWGSLMEYDGKGNFVFGYFGGLKVPRMGYGFCHWADICWQRAVTM